MSDMDKTVVAHAPSGVLRDRVPQPIITVADAQADLLRQLPIYDGRREAQNAGLPGLTRHPDLR